MDNGSVAYTLMINTLSTLTELRPAFATSSGLAGCLSSRYDAGSGGRVRVAGAVRGSPLAGLRTGAECITEAA